MDDARAKLSRFLAHHANMPGEPPDEPPDDADLFRLLRIEGDDASEFIQHFAETFAVDMDGYRWYFHHAEEGPNFGSVVFPSPDQRVKRIPITRRILAEAIETGRWPITYPDHEIPRVRWDVRIGCALIAAPAAVMLALWVWGRLAR